MSAPCTPQNTLCFAHREEHPPRRGKPDLNRCGVVGRAGSHSAAQSASCDQTRAPGHQARAQRPALRPRLLLTAGVECLVPAGVDSAPERLLLQDLVILAREGALQARTRPPESRMGERGAERGGQDRLSQLGNRALHLSLRFVTPHAVSPHGGTPRAVTPRAITPRTVTPRTVTPHTVASHPATSRVRRLSRRDLSPCHPSPCALSPLTPSTRTAVPLAL